MTFTEPHVSSKLSDFNFYLTEASDLSRHACAAGDRKTRNKLRLTSKVAVWLRACVVELINEVTLRRGVLALGTETGDCSVFSQSTLGNSAWPSLRGLALWLLLMATATARE